MRQFRPDRHRYHIEKSAGEGLSANVFEAARIDSRGHSQQKVALKVLKDKNAVSFLRREFDALTKVQSPHCARVLAWENSGADCAIVLEWIEGVTLLEAARAHQFDSELVGEVVSQIAIGLKDLAACGLHHGDLHPKNVMIDRAGRVVLLDFAVQERRSDSERRGAPAYLAPEVWRGSPPSLASDLFALGLLARDLENGFSRVPTSVRAAKRRAELSARPESPLLHPLSEQRRLPETTSISRAKERLAQIVCRLQDERHSLLTTSVFEKPAEPKRRVRYSVSLALLGLCLMPVIGLPVRAEAPVMSFEPTARLIIRSHRWSEFALDGKEIGYAPIEIDGLQPGQHRLQWRTAKGSGQIKLRLSPGQSLRLSGDDIR